jgi:Plasmid recombination enzyme
MAFAIMRCKKLSSMGNVAGSLSHCFRERDTPNADPELTPENEILQGTGQYQESLNEIKKMLPEKRRKDAVLAVEYVMTASPEWFENASPKDQEEFFSKSMEFLKNKYGEQNILTAVIHRDETTPHLSAYVVPITKDGRLSAKEFIGGKAKMTADQTEFAKGVKHLGLERGIEGTKTPHQSIKQFYARIDRPLSIPSITADEVKPQRVEPKTIIEKIKGVFESESVIAERINKKFKESFAETHEKASKSLYNEQKIKSLENVLVKAENRNQSIHKLFNGLSRKQGEEVVNLANQFRLENLEKEREKQRLIDENKKQKQILIDKEREEKAAYEEAQKLIGKSIDKPWMAEVSGLYLGKVVHQDENGTITQAKNGFYVIHPHVNATVGVNIEIKYGKNLENPKVTQKILQADKNKGYSR